MKILEKIKKKSGQQTIEYVVLMTLIMAGIIVMGPYIIRSWNANLKGWEDSTLDTLQDPLIQADSGDVEITPCLPQGWFDEGCGLGISTCLGKESCSPVEMLERQKFDPLYCECSTIKPTPPLDTIAKCRIDPCCCTAPKPTGRCGVNAPVTKVPLPCSNTTMTPKNTDGSCPDGMMENWVLCGYDVDPVDRRYGCVSNPACIFSCQTPPQRIINKNGYGDVCSGGVDERRLPDNSIHYSYVDKNKCTPTKCEIECEPPAFSFGTACDVCPSGSCRVNTCAAGFVYLGPCGAGQCTRW